MEEKNSIVFGILRISIISLVIIASILIISNAFLSRNKDSEAIQVTGLGTKDFESDLIVWSGEFSQNDLDLKNAYSKLYADQSEIISFLEKREISQEEFIFSAVNIKKEFQTFYDNQNNRKQKFKGYVLTQSIKIESKEIEKIEAISREITELINSGVEFYSNAPQYYYTKLSELKQELIEQATANAKERAETIATQSGFKLGVLKNASMGVFQIIARNSNEEYSWGGSFNITSKQKTATITMKLKFGIR